MVPTNKVFSLSWEFLMSTVEQYKMFSQPRNFMSIFFTLLLFFLYVISWQVCCHHKELGNITKRLFMTFIQVIHSEKIRVLKYPKTVIMKDFWVHNVNK